MDNIKDEIGQNLVESLESQGDIDNSRDWSQQNNFDHDLVVGVAKSLCANEIVVMPQFETTEIHLTQDGQSILKSGSPEVILFENLPVNGRVNKNDLLVYFDSNEKLLQIAMNQGNRLKLFKTEKEGTKEEPLIYLSRHVTVVDDTTQEQLKLISSGHWLEVPVEIQNELKRRKLITVGKVHLFQIQKGPKIYSQLENQS